MTGFGDKQGQNAREADEWRREPSFRSAGVLEAAVHPSAARCCGGRSRSHPLLSPSGSFSVLSGIMARKTGDSEASCGWYKLLWGLLVPKNAQASAWTRTSYVYTP